MEVSNLRKTHNASSKPSVGAAPEDLKEAMANLELRLAALDQKGEVGLQEALDRIYPPSPLARVPFGPAFPESFARVIKKSHLKTIPYSALKRSGGPK